MALTIYGSIRQVVWAGRVATKSGIKTRIGHRARVGKHIIVTCNRLIGFALQNAAAGLLRPILYGMAIGPRLEDLTLKDKLIESRACGHED